ncbi:MAG: hypothetical protein V3R68_07230, partial [Gammaproteobacteria bacterium]
MSKRWRGGLIAFLLMILSGCTVLQELDREPVFDAGSTCIQLFDTLDRAVDEAGTRDAQATRIAGFPFLRINRFLASFRDEIEDEGSFNFWVDQLHALDMEARQYEIRNTPLELFGYEYGGSDDSSPLLDRIRDCGSKLRLSVNVNNRQILADHLLKRAVVPDVYSNLKRFLGIYPLSRLFVLRGIEYLQRSTYERFQQPLHTLPVKGRLVRYAPQETTDAISDEDIKRILWESSDNPPGIPILSIRTQKRLFDKFAPIWEIDVTTDNDHIGTPYWETETRLAIDTKKPHVFRHLSYTRVDGKVLVQLNYVIWFPARPRSGYFDLLGGHIDGITWRVTLGSDGYPVFYDSMHNCGCYHLFFPTNHIIPRVLTGNQEKPVLLPDL